MAWTDLEIATGIDVTWPGTFAQDRFRRVYYVNGINRGKHYLPFGSSADLLGIDPPSTAPTLTAAGSGSITGSYNGYIRFVDDRDGHKIYSNLSTKATVSLTSKAEIEWTGVDAIITADAVSRVSHVEFWRTIDTDTTANKLFLVATQGKGGSINSISDNGSSKCRFNVPAGHSLTVGAVIIVTGNSVSAYNTTHEVTAIANETFDTDVAFTSTGTGGTWQLEGFKADTNSDATLLALEGTTSYMLLTTYDLDSTDLTTRPNANRFVVPPDYMSVVQRYGDRAWYAVPREFDGDGDDVDITNGDDQVTSNNSKFLTNHVGRFIEIEDEAEPYEITAINASNDMEVGKGVSATRSAKSYIIRPEAKRLLQIFFSEQDEFESVPDTNVVTIQENVDDTDRITGLIPRASQLLIATQRHIYRLYYFTDPHDSHITHWKRRGLINQDCWAQHENADIYAMDDRGPYLLRSSSIIPIGDAIGDKWRDRAIVDWANKRWFKVHVDQTEELVYFFVGYAADSSTRPKRAFVWSIRAQQWQPGPDLYPWEIGGLTDVSFEGQQKTVVGGVGGGFYLLNDGIYDGTVGGGGSDNVRGNPTAVTSTTLEDTGGNFPADAHRSTVAIVKGPGQGQIRNISSGGGTNTITISSAWTTNPTTDSTYIIGAIEYFYKTGLFPIVSVNVDNPLAFCVTFTPTGRGESTELPAEFYLRRYMNHDVAAKAHTERPDDELVDKGISWSLDSDRNTDVVCDMLFDRSILADLTGEHRWEFGGHGSGESHMRFEKDRWVAAEIRGFAGGGESSFRYKPVLEFHSLEIEGVEG